MCKQMKDKKYKSQNTDFEVFKTTEEACCIQEELPSDNIIKICFDLLFENV